MSKFTKRDGIWNAVLETAIQQGEFSTADVRETFDEVTPPQHKTPAVSTTTDCLHTMSEMGYIEQPKNRGDKWIVTTSLLDPNIVFQVFAVMLQLGSENEIVRTRDIKQRIEIDSSVLVTLSLEVLERNRVVHRKTKEGERSKWFLEI
jgi:DNA-binding MarR family transcriptional regulator